MTSDAKLGLLVGLILIIAIVFALNGLPGIIKAASDNTSAAETVIKVATEDIMSNARETIHALEQYETPQDQTQSFPDSPPGSTLQIAESYNVQIPEQTAKPQTVDTETQTTAQTEYTVQANDNLATIAKKFYGPEEGNRLVNIEKIAKFNNLKSIDFVYKGQKLIIPQLNENQQKQFVKVKSFSSQIRNVINLPTVSVTNKIPGNVYIVRDGDTLWSIADKTLNNGNRFSEILKLNSHIPNPNHLEPGMKLKLPNK